LCQFLYALVWFQSGVQTCSSVVMIRGSDLQHRSSRTRGPPEEWQAPPPRLSPACLSPVQTTSAASAHIS
jgi:hypothetical protein